MLSDFLNLILQWVAAHPGWMGLIVFLTAMGESLAVVGLILPGAAMMVGFGALIALGHLEFWSTWAWAVVGAIVGDGLSFWLGRTFHQQLRQRRPFSSHPDIVDRAVTFFQAHGGKSVLLGRFIGPLRPVIPAVAGMLDMPVGLFLLVNIGSALLWAPAYLLPGMAFGASLELAAQVTGRLVVLLLLLLSLLGLTAWLVRYLFRRLQPHVQDWLKRFLLWSRDHPLLSFIGHSLLDPEQDEIRGLSMVALLLLSGLVFIALLLFAVDQRLPTTLDLYLYHFFQSLRTPWVDRLMVACTELGDAPVKLALALTVFAWLLWQRARLAALHWLAALGFGLAIATLLKWLFQVPRPMVTLDNGLFSYAFPSNHAALTTILFGFLAVLIARELPPAKRWLPYLGATLLVVSVAFSRLYLGAQWFTDTLGGISLGVAWVALLGLAYSRHRLVSLSYRSLLAVSLLAVLAAYLGHRMLHQEQELARYQPQPNLRIMARDAWWRGDWRQFPTQRLDWQGNRRQALLLQWAAPLPVLKQRLHAAGWQIPPPLTWQRALQWLNPQVQLAQLPVLPRLHDGHPETLVMVHPGTTVTRRWVLQCWDSETRLEPGYTPLWLCGLSLQTLQHRLAFFNLAVDAPGTPVSWDLLQPALLGLRQQSLALPEQRPTLLLLSD
ncbi:MAG: VTT domain-containing protein [Candidatus Competibacteraceae bacterium]